MMYHEQTGILWRFAVNGVEVGIAFPTGDDPKSPWRWLRWADDERGLADDREGARRALLRLP